MFTYHFNGNIKRKFVARVKLLSELFLNTLDTMPLIFPDIFLKFIYFIPFRLIFNYRSKQTAKSDYINIYQNTFNLSLKIKLCYTVSNLLLNYKYCLNKFIKVHHLLFSFENMQWFKKMD